MHRKLFQKHRIKGMRRREEAYIQNKKQENEKNKSQGGHLYERI
jgi:hypothetical protein